VARATATSASHLSFHAKLAVFHNMIFCDYGMEHGKEWAVAPKRAQTSVKIKANLLVKSSKY